MGLLRRTTSLDLTATVLGSPRRVFDFLADPVNQCWVADGSIDMLSRPTDTLATGATVALRGPIGLRRRGELRVLGSHAPFDLMSLIDGPCDARWFLFWEIAPAEQRPADEHASVVRLRAIIRPSSFVDRMLSGGRPAEVVAVKRGKRRARVAANGVMSNTLPQTGGLT